MRATRIPIVPLQGATPFPGCASIFEADREYIERVRNHIEDANGQVALVKWNGAEQRPTPKSLSPLGVLARIAILPYVGDKVIVAVEGSESIALKDISENDDGVIEGSAVEVSLVQRKNQQQAG